jgi:outer membrane biogenesis lipoprotein LolB
MARITMTMLLTAALLLAGCGATDKAAPANDAAADTGGSR